MVCVKFYCFSEEKMKKRLHNKKAGIAILISLIVISLAEIIFRAVAMGLEAVLTTANFGEQLAVIALAVTILVLTAKGKDRACYICYGAWLGYFALDQLFELPGLLTEMFALYETVDFCAHISIALRILSMIFIIFIGVLLIEYMNDGTIFNKAFNILCIASVLSIFISIIITVIHVIENGEMYLVLDIFNNIYRLAMIFMFTFFAYDSAKAQLKKTNLTK